MLSKERKGRKSTLVPLLIRPRQYVPVSAYRPIKHKDSVVGVDIQATGTDETGRQNTQKGHKELNRGTTPTSVPKLLLNQANLGLK